MTIPKKVKIGGLNYKINITNNITLGDRYVGEILYSDLQINLRPTNPNKMEQTFWHELTHGIYEHCGYNPQDEEMVDRISACLYQVLTDNKLLK